MVRAPHFDPLSPLARDSGETDVAVAAMYGSVCTAPDDSCGRHHQNRHLGDRHGPKLDILLAVCHTQVMSDTDVVEVGPKGRVVIPAAIRKRLGLEQGTRLAVLVDGEAVVLVPRPAVEQRLHSIFKGVPASMADELIGERRAEAAADI